MLDTTMARRPFVVAWICWCCIIVVTSFSQLSETRLKGTRNTIQASIIVNSDSKELDEVHLTHHKHPPSIDNEANHEPTRREEHLKDDSRRRLIVNSITLFAFTAVHPSLLVPHASASIPEIDATGNLFTPKADMLKGGSTAARGIPLAQSSSQRTGELQESIYEPRFVTYLARFLLNYEPSARAYWTSQGYGLSWDSASVNNGNDQILFAAFAESVEVGLADYFSGPFGSYSSVSAAIAGLTATKSAPAQPSRVKKRKLPRYLAFFEKPTPPTSSLTAISKAKQGILNLYSLLKARYNSIPAKRQLAILFAMISDTRLQPISEIQQLLGEIDNCLVYSIDVKRLTPSQSSTRLLGKDNALMMEAESGFRYYSKSEVPQVRIDAPAPLGDDFCPAKAVATTKCTGRVLRITVTDGGEGYNINVDKDPPSVTLITGRAVPKAAKATAILNRHGQIESILVLNPGEGYRRPPVVRIEPPGGKKGRMARAYAELEYEVARLSITDPGNGYVSTEPPEVNIEPPRNGLGDWVVFDSIEQPRAVPILVFPDGTPADLTVAEDLSTDSISRIQRDPLELLPSTVRPERIFHNSVFCYAVTSLDKAMFAQPQANRALYRAFDPIFGGIGRVPVTVNANALTMSEYGRLALSGAVCTVIVRTLLNPLELIKTKQQLNSDVDLLDFATKHVTSQQSTELSGSEGSVNQRQRLGTIDLIKAMVDLRGTSSLFQSLDITFLASLVFGSFGFGATELFRRSFAELSDGTGSEITLLLAASAATVLTAAAASPFEVLRVRSMGLIEAKPWLQVLKEFLVRHSPYHYNSSILVVQNQKSERQLPPADDFDFKSLSLSNLLSLWSGFAPILSRELPFAIAKFITFDAISSISVDFLNANKPEGSIPIQVGAGTVGLSISALSGAIAGVAGAIVSHPADLILTKTSAASKQSQEEINPGWVEIVRDLISQEGGITNLFAGLSSRSVFFFLVIGLQVKWVHFFVAVHLILATTKFFLYDYVKSLFQVGSDDLSLVLDVFYAVRAGLVNS